MEKTKGPLRVILVIVGMVFLALGTVGIFLPILPTVPLYMLAAACLARGSERLGSWFEGTSLYRAHVLPIRKGEGMTMRAKVTSFALITALLAMGFAMMGRVPWARWILVAVEAFHAWLFFLHLPTRPRGA